MWSIPNSMVDVASRPWSRIRLSPMADRHACSQFFEGAELTVTTSILVWLPTTDGCLKESHPLKLWVAGSKHT